MPEQPWWAKPGGAPTPGQPMPPPAATPRSPRPTPPTPPTPRPVAPRPVAPRPASPYSAPQTPAPWPSPPAAPQRRQSSKQRSYLPLLWVGLAVVVAAVAVLIGVFLGAGGGGTELDVAKAEAGVAEILSDPTYGYGANDVGDVVCNEGRNPEVEAGAGFSCDVVVNGNPRRVEVVFTDDAGTYAVDGAR